MSYLDEIEVIKNDESLDSDEKKKAIRKLRRQARKGQVIMTKQTVEDEAIAGMTTQQLSDQLIQESGLPEGPEDLAYYYFSLQGMIAKGTTYTTILEKYKSRWGVDPIAHQFISGETGYRYFGLGPVK